MHIHVRLHLEDALIPCYPELPRELMARTNGSISAKLEQTVLELPCRPCRGDSLNLLSFAAWFGFTEFECELLSDCNYEIEVLEIVICDGWLEVTAKKVE